MVSRPSFTWSLPSVSPAMADELGCVMDVSYSCPGPQSSAQSLVQSQGRAGVNTAGVGATETWVPFPALALTDSGLLNKLLPLHEV